MGNTIDSFFSGFFNSIGNLFRSPLDFLSGKSCSSVCESPWDFICFVEHFCVAHLVKMAIILIFSYLFLLFIYVLYKVGFFQCIVHGLCSISWAFLSCWFSSCKFCLTFLCSDLINPNPRRRHRKRRSENAFYAEEDTYSPPPRRFGTRGREERMRKSLRPRSHRVRVWVRRNGDSLDRYGGRNQDYGSVRGIRVSRSSKFARKGSKYRRR
ncbi:PREDICTED: uncharacterized protein LOC104800210 [Tarenaya hassleriana]|uniref:uncharacterized protein LOC104800210 n=1 Tax=Tarenaya hassleriana TaxID=28532 RepID=UPI00053C9784|nr:PREDICTED: uncharacterized protein LOC104800210 [Tarenaya hassleriana]